MSPIVSFSGKYRFLSNFYPCGIILDGELYSSLEHAYQAAKTEDTVQRAVIRSTSKPGDAKRAGYKVTLRGNWNILRLAVMKELLTQKFSDPDLRRQLLATGDVELVEGNTWNDTFWGVCRGRGENQLGLLLMEVRREAANITNCKDDCHYVEEGEQP